MYDSIAYICINRSVTDSEVNFYQVVTHRLVKTCYQFILSVCVLHTMIRLYHQADDRYVTILSPS